MTYKLNGTILTAQPESGQWTSRDAYGVDGAGHSIYPANRKFQLRWGLISVADFQQILNLYNGASSTGSVVATLPQFGASSFTFFDYTGAVMQEPTVGTYFEEYVTEVELTLVNIQT